MLALSWIILMAVFLFFSPSFSGELRVVQSGRSYQNRQLWAPNLRFFWPGVFYCLGLGLSPGCGGVHRLIASVAVLISIVGGGGLYIGLGLSFGCFFNQSALTV